MGSTASKIGRLEEFDYTTDDWTTYAERIEHYFKANDMAEDKKKDALLASIGGKTFTLLRSLTAPGKPGDNNMGNWWKTPEPKTHRNQRKISIFQT